MTTTDLDRDDSDTDEMPDEDMTYDATEPDESKWGALRMIGLLALLAAFAGFVYLAYMQGVRNGAVGAPPVITADQSPYKVPPVDAGGQTFANQDKKIYDRVEGTAPVAGATSPSIADATPKPSPDQTGLAARDAPLVVANNAPATSAPSLYKPSGDGYSLKDPAPVAQASPTSGATVPETASKPMVAKPADNVAQGHADGIAAAIERADGNGQGGPNNVADEISPKEVDTPPAPKAAQAPAPASGVTATVAPAASVAAAASVSGAYLVQIASYKDEPSAKDAWTKFSQRFSDVVADAKPDYQTADVPGKGTYTRLRIGPFDSKDAANEMCHTLKARSQGCIVVKG